MPTTSFSDDLKSFVNDTKASVQRHLEPVVAKIRTLPPGSRGKIVACGVAAAVLVVGLALRGSATSESSRPAVRTADIRPSLPEPRPANREGLKSYAVGKAEESHGSYRSAAESYATAARKGDKRGLKKLVAMSRARKCEARSEAADALGTLRDRRAVAALKKLAKSKFRDEAANPGIFSCSSRRAAQKALERRARG